MHRLSTMAAFPAPLNRLGSRETLYPLYAPLATLCCLSPEAGLLYGRSRNRAYVSAPRRSYLRNLLLRLYAPPPFNRGNLKLETAREIFNLRRSSIFRKDMISKVKNGRTIRRHFRRSQLEKIARRGPLSFVLPFRHRGTSGFLEELKAL